jgi:hypothetical protein
MDMHEARDIAVRFLGGLAVSDDEVVEAGNTIREGFRENGLIDDDLDMRVEVVAAAFADDDGDLDEVR